MVSNRASKPLSPLWNLLYVPVILATIALTVALWPSMPDQIPVHAGLDGTVNRWASKSDLYEVDFPVIMQVFLAVVTTITHMSTLKAQPQSRTSRLESASLLGVGLALVVGCGGLVFAYAGYLSLNDYALAFLVLVSIVLVAVIALIVRARRSGAYDSDDGDCWKGGVFYYAPDDPRIMVPKRVASFGWTLNFANWRSWLVLLGMLAVIIGFVAFCMTASS